uniref:TSA: Wollemia nobilis Ref_Wollemi_Transcript_12340_1787 transcribed RNA sequence n=1 Tax=Wollemia nobilis TaxID=56998 RepID=A0A0C9S860_9CONI
MVSIEFITHFCSILGIIALLHKFMHPPIFGFLRWWWDSWQGRWDCYAFLRVPEYYGSDGSQENGLFNKIKTYVSTLGGTVDTHYANLYTAKNSNDIYVALDPGESVADSFLGARVWWTLEVSEKAKGFVLKIHKKDKVGVLKPYLEHVQAVAEDIEHRKKELNLYTNGEKFNRDKWTSVAFKHPATFDTIAIEGEVKNKIKMDLEAFARGKQYYHRLGRAWKRGYLLYGPPGTGKSSMIAAMANFMHYDIYDLELTKVNNNSELRMLLMQTSNKSILVIEDIDCSLDLWKREGSDDDDKQKRKDRDDDSDQENGRVTLSGMLNCIDGLWSCCGEERIIVFTTNNKERLDPALLRPGRMDMHIYFPYCSFSTFKMLANNYLGIKEHKLFPHVEEAFQAGTSMTPADVGEILLVNKNSPSRALKALVSALQSSIAGAGNGAVGERPVDNGYPRRSGHEILLRKGSRKGDFDETVPNGKLEHLQEEGQFPFSPNHSFVDLKRLHNLFKTKNKNKSTSGDVSPLIKEPIS